MKLFLPQDTDTSLPLAWNNWCFSGLILASQQYSTLLAIPKSLEITSFVFQDMVLFSLPTSWPFPLGLACGPLFLHLALEWWYSPAFPPGPPLLPCLYTPLRLPPSLPWLQVPSHAGVASKSIFSTPVHHTQLPSEHLPGSPQAPNTQHDSWWNPSPSLSRPFLSCSLTTSIPMAQTKTWGHAPLLSFSPKSSSTQSSQCPLYLYSVSTAPPHFSHHHPKSSGFPLISLYPYLLFCLPSNPSSLLQPERWS